MPQQSGQPEPIAGKRAGKLPDLNLSWPWSLLTPLLVLLATVAVALSALHVHPLVHTLAAALILLVGALLLLLAGLVRRAATAEIQSVSQLPSDLCRQQQALLDAVGDGICGIHRDGRVGFANPAAARLLGAQPDALAGRLIHDLLHGSAPENRRCGPDCPLRHVASHRITASGEENIYRADGSSFPAEYFLTPILDRGRHTGSVLSFRDISERHALERQKDEFISTVSHELRTPLTSIRGALGLLSSGVLGPVNAKASNLLRIALTNSDRLVRLINDILDLERIQSGRERLAFRPVQLDEVVRQAIDGMSPVADQAGVRLVHDAQQVQIFADPDHLLQVLTNLLSNAVKFSPQGSEVRVTLATAAEGVTLSVIDSGRGIPEDKLETIFGRFRQVEAADAKLKGGSGLGLAICRTIVQQHSGRIWAERNAGPGCTFRVFLPYQPAMTTASAASTYDANTATVLLADAHGVTRPMVASNLSQHGYRVLEAATVEQTLSAAHAGVQAILLDTALDGMNGFAILPQLRRLDPEARTPVVLLSLDDSKDDAAALAAGADAVVHSPLDENALLGELALVLCGPGECVRILVVEDDQDLAHIVAEIFTRHGIQVETAYTRQQAQDACANFRPHLMVLDIGLPDGDGFGVVDWLRQHASLAAMPLVVYSGHDLNPAERRQLTLGPTHFLTKARVHPQQLEALVLTMLRSSREVAPARQ